METEKQKLETPLFSAWGVDRAEFTHFADRGKWVTLYGKSVNLEVKIGITRKKAIYLGLIAS